MAEQYYCVQYYNDVIKVVVTKKAAVVDLWIHRTLQAHCSRLGNLTVGLDIEWLPCFKPDDNHPAALLQLCVGRHCLLFQLLHADATPRYLKHFLGNRNIRFVGVGVEGDAEKLLADHGLFVANPIDLNKLAAAVYGEEVYGKMGLKRMANEVLGKIMEKPKKVTLSCWDAEFLSYEQVEYGCIDAFVSFEIARNLLYPSRDIRTCHHQPQQCVLID